MSRHRLTPPEPAHPPTDRPQPRRRASRHRLVRPPTGARRRRALIVLVAAALTVVGLPSAGLAAADHCHWPPTRPDTATETGGHARAAWLREVLARAGVGPKRLAGCRPAGTPAPSTSATAAPTPSLAPSQARASSVPPPSTAAPRPPVAAPTSRAAAPRTSASLAPPAPVSTGSGATAADRFGWGTPARTEDFDAGLSAWNVYDGPGHAGNGRRTPAAVSVTGGVLTITGDAGGSTGGMEWGAGQRFGRWEGRVRAPVSDPSYNALLLLWPDAENFPVGGEIDFMEMLDHTRRTTNAFLHYGSSNSQVSGEVSVDAAQWHNWAVEWTPDHVATFVDGKQWWRVDNAGILPPGPMHLCIQLDWFPKGGGVTPSQMQVDWVRQYTL